MNRRCCIAAGTVLWLWTVLSPVNAADTGRPVSPLDSLPIEIPEELRGTLAEVPPSRNAYVTWTDAAALIVEPALYSVRRRFEELAADAPYTPGPLARAVAGWLARNEPALLRLEEGLSCEGCRFRPPAGEAGSVDRSADLRRLAAMKFVRGKHRLAGGNVSGALSDFRDLLHLGRTVLEGDGAVLYFLAGASISEMGLRGLWLVSASPGIDESTVVDTVRMAGGMPGLWPALRRALEAEFREYGLAYLAGLPEDKEALAAAFTEEGQEPARFRVMLASVACPDGSTPAGDALMRERFARLIDLHPRPLDRAATVRAAVDEYMALLRAVDGGWSDCRARLVDIRDARRSFAASYPAIARHLQGEATDADKKALRRIDNPLGILLVASAMHVSDVLVRAPKLEALHIAAGTAAAVRIFRERRDTWPSDLRSLVEDEILDRVPVDPFDGLPLRYSASRKRLWSVGADGRDDGGTGSDATRWSAPDAVWTLDSP